MLDAVVAADFARRLAEVDFDLPVLPEAATAILTETARPEWQASVLVDILKRDPTMSAHLLRLANSPAFAPASPIVSLPQAISRLGASALKQVAILIACETRVFRIPGFEAAMRSVFRHSLATALYAQEIARGRRSNVEEAFLGGILHDVGWPILVQALVDLHVRHARTVNHLTVLLTAQEAHERVGRALASKWKLPDRVALALEQHHHLPASASELSWVVAYADALARVAAKEASPQSLIDHPAVAALNLYPDVVDALIARGEALWAMAKTS